MKLPHSVDGQSPFEDPVDSLNANMALLLSRVSGVAQSQPLGHHVSIKIVVGFGWALASELAGHPH